MNRADESPVMESRFEQGQQPLKNGGFFKIILIVLVVLGMLTWGLSDLQPIAEEQDEFLVEMEEAEDYESLSEEELTGEVEVPIEEEQTAAFYYQRALEYEKKKDFEAAVADYDHAISLAKKYSAEMWSALNNRGIIRAQQFQDYKGSLKDFNQIIKIETNRYDGEINETRLEAGYTNRAYIKMQMGQKESACDDLYEALSLGVEGSEAFIEKQIDQNCL